MALTKKLHVLNCPYTGLAGIVNMPVGSVTKVLKMWENYEVPVEVEDVVAQPCGVDIRPKFVIPLKRTLSPQTAGVAKRAKVGDAKSTARPASPFTLYWSSSRFKYKWAGTDKIRDVYARSSTQKDGSEHLETMQRSVTSKYKRADFNMDKTSYAATRPSEQKHPAAETPVGFLGLSCLQDTGVLMSMAAGGCRRKQTCTQLGDIFSTNPIVW